MDGFEIANGVLKSYSGKDWIVTVPEGVTALGDGAFKDNRFVRSVTLSDGVSEIGNEVFKGCVNLVHIKIPASVNKIGAAAFNYCEKLRSVIIPDGVSRIEAMTFCGCSDLAEVVVPKNTVAIEKSAFSLCSSLTEFVIPEKVTEIGDYVFFGATSLVTVTIHDGVKRIGKSAFGNCFSLEKLTVPRSVTEIGDGAFGAYPSSGRLDIGYELVPQLGDWHTSIWAAVRDFLCRFYEGTTTAEENVFWRGYIGRRTAKVFEYMTDEPMMYRYLTENRIIATKRVPALLDITHNTECRAILLDYANGGKRKKSNSDPFDTLFDL